MKYRLYIRQYDITTNDYKVRKEIVETNDIYHEIGKIYSNAFTEIKRIDYEKIDETKELKNKIREWVSEHSYSNGIDNETYFTMDSYPGELLKILDEENEDVE